MQHTGISRAYTYTRRMISPPFRILFFRCCAYTKDQKFPNIFTMEKGAKMCCHDFAAMLSPMYVQLYNICSLPLLHPAF